MQRIPVAHPPAVFQSEAHGRGSRVNAVDGFFGSTSLETCTHPAPVYAGMVHGVNVCFGERTTEGMPVGDRDGTERPYITIKIGCSSTELFEAVCRARGRYDIHRALDGLDPFEWGPIGTWQDAALVVRARPEAS